MSSFPNVPNAPGVPPIRRSPSATFNNVSILVSDLVRLFSAGPQWGIYRNGRNVISAPQGFIGSLLNSLIGNYSFVGLDWKKGWAIADYPIEGGGFESYDKVEQPFDARVRLAAGGSLDNRKALLSAVEAIAGDLLTYDIVTPEKTYLSVNVERYDYRRFARDGVGLLTIDMFLREIRVNATAEFTNVKSPQAAGQTSGGTVQPATPTPQQSALSSLVQ